MIKLFCPNKTIETNIFLWRLRARSY